MIQDRIIQFIEYKGLTKYKFYKKTNLSNGFLDKKGTIGVDKCEIIYSFFPEINLEWLITGNGEMLKSNTISGVVQENSGIDYKELAEARKETIDLLRDKVNYLETENARLKQELANSSGNQSRVAG